MRLIALLLGLLALLPLRAADRPNLLVLLVDDLGLMDSSVPFLADAEGTPEIHPLNRRYRTPALERLAATGIRFETFYANSVCSPTRVSLMTGHSSARHHTTQWIRPDANNRGRLGPRDWQWQGIRKDQPTLPRLLQQAGYRTIHVGKAHFGPQGSLAENPENFGFDQNIGGGAMGQPASYYATDHFGWKDPEAPKTHAVPGLDAYHGQDLYLTEALTREMHAAIRSAVRADQPFFAYLAYYAVHAPFQPDPRFLQAYPDLPPQPRAFATMVASVDHSVGHLLDGLETLGVAADTLVLFLGDNGSDAPLGPSHEITSSAPLRGKKATHYEGGMRVPFIAAWARPDPSHPLQQRLPIASGVLSREMADITDILPTLLAAADVKLTHPVDGDDLAPALAGGSLDRPREWLMHFPHGHRSSYFTVYRQDDWKLIYHYTRPRGQRCELYDLATDRSEQTDLAPTRPEVRQRLLRAMIRALEEADAQYPLASPDATDPTPPQLE